MLIGWIRASKPPALLGTQFFPPCSTPQERPAPGGYVLIRAFAGILRSVVWSRVLCQAGCWPARSPVGENRGMLKRLKERVVSDAQRVGARY